ncbi:pseudaminic acid cytidylyltransferase [Frateuria edaphi]|uniref:pseudaminic acid cytidylyltransferase n=1 Tax=Frateuria edaphi TaxID=2898793 RepID=UPI001E472CCD|nr:pseudaminic acid cytidylyltransferase [Frateuria edaphi]UGB46559.1 pseudaminic acid cytidylyltransferase [Frateuria edaphi]
MRLAVIPARGGSKRIPRKNIKMFHGRPVIAWSIDAARRSQCFDTIVVSTDDEEIARVAETCGALVPFPRPAELAGDHVATQPVVAHAIDWFVRQGLAPDPVCCIYATAPLLAPEDIVRGMEALESSGGDYAFAVTSYAFPIQRAIRITGEGRVEMFDPAFYGVRSQDLEPAFHDAGQFYWGRASAWCTGKPIFSHNAVPVHLPRHRVQDIDTPEDWARAEWLFESMQSAAHGNHT